MNPRDVIPSGDPRWKEAHVCGHKSQLTEGDAWQTANRFRARGDPDAHAYRCPYCGFHHVGTQRDRRKNRKQLTGKAERRRLKLMRESEAFDVQDGSETDILTDPEYQQWADSYDEATRAAIDAEHASCTVDNPTGMCASCEASYELARKVGAEDERMGIPIVEGFANFRAWHPEVPRVSMGAIEGYGHGWSHETLRAIVQASKLPHVDFVPYSARGGR